ncbi:MAG: ribbon-helix-helix protein, CopG family [Deltaproteobacteria bacterium]|nr:ribbon-helix-helix protein, CopG family [Deltaproteobacteria bacterium]MBW1911312.1 ribbon-helix-helix protein, CopG family [Deltaproteobacteria bacterium]MBW2330083.1 ribbon-helix-helix protein, CopG family [Deltaproteobacteria bacterium]
MAKTVTTRLDDEYVKKIDEMAARKGIDRSALLRSFLLGALKEYTIRDSLEDYKAGITTLWEVAQRCNLSLWEMTQEVKRAHIHTFYDLKEFEKDLRALNG